MPLFESSGTVTTVTNSATQVFSTSGLTSPRDVTVINQGPAACYVGGGTVTTTSGVQCLPGGQVSVTGQAAQNLWAITASGTCQVLAGLVTVAVAV